MYTRPAIINNYKSSLYDVPVRGLRNIIAYSDNTGNILFLNSIGDQIQNCTPVNIYNDFMGCPEEFMEKYDVLVLPMANMVSPTWRSPELLDMLEKYPIPIVLVSIGIQADTKEELKDFHLSVDAKRLLDLAAQRSSTIGVRGAVTAELLAELGYPVQIIGCPSVFSHPVKTVCNCKNTFEHIATHCTLHGLWREDIKNLFTFSRKYAQSYIAQSELRFLVDTYDIPDETLEQWIQDPDRLVAAKNRLFEYSYYSNNETEAQELRAWVRKSLKYFVDIQDWTKTLSELDLIVGTRFHGTIVGLLAGTPSLLLTTDLRTKELAEYHHIPHVPISVLTPTTTPEDLRQYLNFDSYWTHRNLAHLRYFDFLRKNNLEAATNYL